METPKTNEAVISYDQAKSEVNAWLDAKKISGKKREDNKDNIETIVSAVMDGTLVINADSKVITHNLKFPITSGDKPIDKLDYKSRLDVSTVHRYLQGIKASDGDGRILAYVAALSSKPKELFAKFDTEDFSISQAIVIFFL